MVFIFQFNTFVPIHCSTMSGSTYAQKSNSNGKSNSLVISNCCLPSSALILVFSCIAILFLGFVGFHDGFQFIKPVIPQFSEWFDEVCSVLTGPPWQAYGQPAKLWAIKR